MSSHGSTDSLTGVEGNQAAITSAPNAIRRDGQQCIGVDARRPPGSDIPSTTPSLRLRFSRSSPRSPLPSPETRVGAWASPMKRWKPGCFQHLDWFRPWIDPVAARRDMVPSHVLAVFRQSRIWTQFMGEKMMRPTVILVAFGAFAVAWSWSSSVCGSEPDLGEDLRSKSSQQAPSRTERASGDAVSADEFAFDKKRQPRPRPTPMSNGGAGSAGGDLPDLIIQSSSRSPATGVVPGGMVTLSDTVENQGTAPAGSAFWATWHISEDMTVTLDDYEWAFHQVVCCLGPGQTAGGFGDVAWPDSAPYNTPGQVYYIAVMADDLDEVAESDEANNWGDVWPVVLAGGPGNCPGEGDCCQDNGTPGCDDVACCEVVCAVDASCCEVGWDQACADMAVSLCSELCAGHEACPGEGDCCSPNGTAGCDDTTCCNIVCAADPFCCDTEWDATCAIEAEDLCESVCPGFEDDVYEPDNMPADATLVSC